jgi:tyrosine-specific transport protein
MSTEMLRESRASRAIVGTMIGVGMLALPFVIARVGLVLGVVALMVIAVIMGVVLELYADLVIVRGGKARFIHVVGKELGHAGTFLVSTAYIGSIYGALMAYGIFGGQFLRTVTFSFFPLTPTESMVAFFLLGAICTVGGSLSVARLQRALLPVFFVLMAGLSVVMVPYMQWSALMTFHPLELGSAFGVMIFAFHGISAIPEARDFLDRSAKRLPHVIWRSLGIVLMVYVVFSALVVAVTGTNTTENALTGLRETLGHSMFVFASSIALLVTITAFMNVATSLTNTYLYDVRLRFIPSWVLTMGIPFCVLLVGAPSMTEILNVTGGVLGAITGIGMLVAYERARMSAELPKNSLRVPQIVVGLTFCVFFAVLVSSLWG